MEAEVFKHQNVINSLNFLDKAFVAVDGILDIMQKRERLTLEEYKGFFYFKNVVDKINQNMKRLINECKITNDSKRRSEAGVIAEQRSEDIEIECLVRAAQDTIVVFANSLRRVVENSGDDVKAEYCYDLLDELEKSYDEYREIVNTIKSYDAGFRKLEHGFFGNELGDHDCDLADHIRRLAANGTLEAPDENQSQPDGAEANQRKANKSHQSQNTEVAALKTPVYRTAEDIRDLKRGIDSLRKSAAANSVAMLENFEKPFDRETREAMFQGYKNL